MTYEKAAGRLRELGERGGLLLRPPGGGAGEGGARGLSLRAQLFDVALAAALAGVNARYATTGQMAGPVDWTGGTLLVPLVAAPLALRRRFPLPALWAVLALALAVRGDSPDIAYFSGVVCLVALYSATVHSPNPVPALVSLPVAVAVVVVLFDGAQLPQFHNSVVAVLVLVPVLAVAYEIRMWRRRVADGHARLSTLEREQLDALRRAVEHERARIARELHDVIA
ncbi:MAG TPA: hypothetical protein VGL02_14695, partial [Streptomyces sp.]